jgi:site-specific recombinase XerD
MKRAKPSRARESSPKQSLKLPDLDQAKSAVLNSLPSKESQRGYRHAIDEFIAWYCSEPRLSFSKSVVTRYRIHLESRELAPGTINGRLAAVRRLAYEAADAGLLTPDLAAGIRRVKGPKNLGVRLGNWLTTDQARALWQVPDANTLKGKRDRALLGLLLGCGLRRKEAAELDLVRLQRRDDHWAIVDLVGKARHVRTVPVPDWVKNAIDAWLVSAGVSEGRVFRCVCRAGKTWGGGVTERVVWHVVKECAKRAAIENLAPHDLRRTCARLCRDAGGELDQIQFLLGHVSVQTTERYLGCKQRIRGAVNDASASNRSAHTDNGATATVGQLRLGVA